MRSLLGDLRYAARTLSKSPGFSLVAVATLALGIGANAAIFAVLDAVVIRPLPYREPGRIVALWEVMEDRGGELWRPSPAGFRAWREQNRVFEPVAAFGSHAATLTAGAEPEGLSGGWASPDYFRVLGLSPALGRFFSAREAAERAPVVVLGNELWRSRFARDPRDSRALSRSRRRPLHRHRGDAGRRLPFLAEHDRSSRSIPAGSSTGSRAKRGSAPARGRTATSSE